MSNSSSGNYFAIVALGANLGDAAGTVRAAMDRLREFSDVPLRTSSLWQTTPVDCPPGSPLFVNAVVALKPRAGETPESLLQRLQALEREFGRERKGIVNEPRSLDLDLIAFGDAQRQSANLILPHPRAHQRRFVLEPLAEILPDVRLPGWPRTARELLDALTSDEAIRRLG